MQPVSNHKLVRERDARRVRELLLVVAISGVLLAPLLIYVWQNSEWIQTGYRLEKLKSQRDVLIEQNHQLRLEKASLETLARVEKVASEQLGLMAPPAGTVVLMNVKSLKPVAAIEPARIASAAATVREGSAQDAAAVSQGP